MAAIFITRKQWPLCVIINIFTQTSPFLTNPDITTPDRFQEIMKSYINAGLEDQIMFGSDNWDIVKSIASVSALDFLTDEQRDKIFYKNAERFFVKSATER
ncbi:MAG: amidohydrolase [Chitinophagaceae bacterium]|nr:amidohydrolase [Chitinophagaceae bacterium]